MASKANVLINMMMENLQCRLSHIRRTHSALAAPLERTIDLPTENQFVLPEVHGGSESNHGNEIPSFSFGGGSMELMAVPKKKVSKHKRGIRNGPKSLKPTPVIIRCKSCGRVKLPHFYCCSGVRGTESSS